MNETSHQMLKFTEQGGTLQRVIPKPKEAFFPSKCSAWSAKSAVFSIIFVEQQHFKRIISHSQVNSKVEESGLVYQQG